MNPTSVKNLLIVGNATSDRTPELEQLSETGVRDEVAAVARAAAELGMNPTCAYVGDPLEFIGNLRNANVDCIFNLCEGVNGDSAYEMNFAALLELTGIPFTGASALLLGVARNKPLAKQILRASGVRVPTGWHLTGAHPEPPAALRFPLICKPACEDASLGIFHDAVIRDAPALRRRIAELLSRYPQDGILVESYIAGREFNVAILRDHGELRILEPSEIDFSALPANCDPITGYEAKWQEDSPFFQATPSRCPAAVDPATRERLQHVARKVAAALRADAYGRVDMRCAPDGTIYVLEYNPNPDITPGAGFAKALNASGIAYPEFVRMMVRDAHRKVRS